VNKTTADSRWHDLGHMMCHMGDVLFFCDTIPDARPLLQGNCMTPIVLQVGPVPSAPFCATRTPPRLQPWRPAATARIHQGSMRPRAAHVPWLAHLTHRAVRLCLAR
jgi:hypothetical protein